MKVYVVFEGEGEYSDRRESIIAVCSTHGLACIETKELATEHGRKHKHEVVPVPEAPGNYDCRVTAHSTFWCDWNVWIEPHEVDE